jgi:hypothetical protein
MHQELFLRIVKEVTQHNPYFEQRGNAAGVFGLYPVQKIMLAIQMLAYGDAANMNDEYIQIAESTLLEALDKFCLSIIDLYSTKYLHHPTKEDVEHLSSINAKWGFPGMLGSLDCMHWLWKNCPMAWKGQFQGKEKVFLCH